MPSATSTQRHDGKHDNGASATNGLAVPALPRRRALPNGRAALGGLLVALSIVVLVSVGEARQDDHLERYVVARRGVAIGERLEVRDLTTAALHVPADALRGRVFRQSTTLVGAVVISPIAAGELIQASAVLGPTDDAPQRQISVPIDAARALGDRLRPGELVDVVATFGTGADAFTVTVVTGARVVAREAAGGTLGDGKREVVLLSVDTAEDGMAVAHAIAAGQISLVRVSGIAAADAAPAYRAPRAAGR